MFKEEVKNFDYIRNLFIFILVSDIVIGINLGIFNYRQEKLIEITNFVNAADVPFNVWNVYFRLNDAENEIEILKGDLWENKKIKLRNFERIERLENKINELRNQILAEGEGDS